MTPTRSRPPANHQALETWIYAWVNETEETHAAVRRRIGMLAVAGMLESATPGSGQPSLIFKGGSSLELRYASKARASRDVDLAFVGDLSDLVNVLRPAFRDGWRGFTASIRDPEDLTIPWANIAGQRLEAKLRFHDKPFSTLKLEVVATSEPPDTEYVPPLSLANIGIDTPGSIPCLSLPRQVAEKIHACTDPLDGTRVNDRVNDVMDLIIIEDLVGEDLDLNAARKHCTVVFDERNTHPWAPVLSVLPDWEDLWARMAEDNSFYITDIYEAVKRANDFIHAIDKAR